MTNVVPFDPASRAPAEPVAPVPPASVETEIALLAAALANPEAFAAASGIVEPEHFHHDIHREIFRTAVSVAAAGQTPTMRAVATALGTSLSGQELIGGATTAQYLARLAEEGIATAPVAGEYARTVRDFWALREIMAAALEPAAGRPFVARQMVEQVLARIDEVRASIVDREHASLSFGAAGQALVEKITKRLQGVTALIPSTGLARVDRFLGGGLHPGTMTTLAARTSMGKSLVACCVAYCVAHQGFGTVYDSPEMSAEQVAARVLSYKLARQGRDVPYEKALSGEIELANAELVTGALYDMRDLPLQIEDGGGVNVFQIAARVERQMNGLVRRRNIKPGLVVIDHAHKVLGSRAFNREDERWREVTTGAFMLGKRLGCAVLLLAQCNRDPEKRDDKRPTLADVRGGGSFEEDSDTVMFFYRPAYYVERSPAYRGSGSHEDRAAAQAEYERTRNLGEIIIDKNRQGPPNEVVHVYVDPALGFIGPPEGAQ